MGHREDLTLWCLSEKLKHHVTIRALWSLDRVCEIFRNTAGAEGRWCLRRRSKRGRNQEDYWGRSGQQSTALYLAWIKASLPNDSVSAAESSPEVSLVLLPGSSENKIIKEEVSRKEKELGRGSRSSAHLLNRRELQEIWKAFCLFFLHQRRRTSVLEHCCYLRCIIQHSEYTDHSASRSRDVPKSKVLCLKVEKATQSVSCFC